MTASNSCCNSLVWRISNMTVKPPVSQIADSMDQQMILRCHTSPLFFSAFRESQIQSLTHKSKRSGYFLEDTGADV